MRRSVWLALVLVFALAGGRASATDYWDLNTTDPDNSTGTDNELYHGTKQQHDLQAQGAVADQDWYFVVNYPQSSYEALIESTSGDLNMFNPTEFQRLDVLGAAVLQSSEFANVGGTGGYSVALRWQHGAGAIQTNFLRARSANCGATCGPEDQYHIRFYETTVSIPRFNNAGGQVTVLLIQNTTGWTRPINATAYFWNGAGGLLGSLTMPPLAARASHVINTFTIPGVAGVSGTISVAHDGGYGGLIMKSVALEPATGFSFDTPGLYKPD